MVRGLVASAILAATVLGFSALTAAQSGAASGTLSNWLALDGSIQYISHSTNQFGWANENSGTPSCPSGTVDVPGSHGLFNCGAPGATGFEPSPATNVNGDSSIIDRTFSPDPLNGQSTTNCGPGGGPDATTFKQGQSFGSQSSYTTPTQNINKKDDLTNAYFVSRQQQTGNNYDPSAGDHELFFGNERANNLGDVEVDVELLQGGANMASCAGPLNMPRTQGDLAFEYEWLIGGGVSLIGLQMWECGTNVSPAPPATQGTACNPGDAGYPNAGYVTITPPSGSIGLAANVSGDIPCGGWVCQTFDANGATATVPADTFAEGGVDLNGVGDGGVCFNSAVTETHESQVEDNSLKDFILSNINTCENTTTTTTPTVGEGQLPNLGSSWTDTATVHGTAASGSPGGSVQFYICSPTQLSNAESSTCSSSIGTPWGGPVDVTPVTSTNNSTASSNPFTPDSTGTWCFAGYYSGVPGTYLPSTDAGSDECFNVTVPDFKVIKSDSLGTGPVQLGTPFTYNVQIQDIGSGPGTAVVTDNVPSNITVNGTPTCPATLPDTCVVNGSGNDWTFTVDLQAGDSVTASFPATVATTDTADAVNTATITTGPCDNSQAPSIAVQSNAAVDNCTSMVTNPVPDFTVAKTDIPGDTKMVKPGDTIPYTVVITNVGDGGGAATITDPLPSSLTLLSTPAAACPATAPDTCTIGGSGNTLTFDVNLAAGDSVTATFSAQVAQSDTATVVNTATITTGPCNTSSGCASTVSNPVPAPAQPVSTPQTSTPPPATSTPTPTTPPPATPATIAFTGADIAAMIAAGLALLGLGGFMVLLSRRRRGEGHAS